MRKRLFLAVCVVCVPGFAMFFGVTPLAGAQGKGVTQEQLLNAQYQRDKWIHYGRNYGAWRHVPLDKINKSNVGRLAPKWTFQTGIKGGGFETSAISYEGKLYLTTANSHLFCVDARTGDLIWRYDHPMPPRVNLCCGPVNRGAAILGGRVYYTTLDARLLCFEAETGLMLWDRMVADYRESYSMTIAPLIVKDKVIVGIAGGEYGIRGFIDAYDVDTGEHVWRFYTIPGEGEPGNETWAGDSWKTGGSATWVTGTYDPDLNLIYWGVGNPGPDFNGDVRLGDNLYSDSVVALDADTGKLVWYFQSTPHDVFDWDAVSEPIIVDEEFEGKKVKAIIHVNRNGYMYVLDRTNGELILARPYTEVNWAEYDEQGKPTLKAELAQSEGRKYVSPGLFGGKNWPPAAYSPDTHYVYIPDMVRPATFMSMEVTFRRGLPYYGGTVEFDPIEDAKGYVRAMDVRSGEIKWSFETPGGPNWAGLLSTGAGIVFGGAPDGYLRAFDAETGEVLWKYQTGSGTFAPPTSFELDGEQYIGLAAGWGQTGGSAGIRRTGEGATYFLFELKDE